MTLKRSSLSSLKEEISNSQTSNPIKNQSPLNLSSRPSVTGGNPTQSIIENQISKDEDNNEHPLSLNNFDNRKISQEKRQEEERREKESSNDGHSLNNLSKNHELSKSFDFSSLQSTQNHNRPLNNRRSLPANTNTTDYINKSRGSLSFIANPNSSLTSQSKKNWVSSSSTHKSSTNGSLNSVHLGSTTISAAGNVPSTSSLSATAKKHSFSSATNPTTRSLLKKKKKSSVSHLENFQRLRVIIDSQISFTIIVDKRNNIEYLTRQIEAEYTFRFLRQNHDLQSPNTSSSSSTTAALKGVYNLESDQYFSSKNNKKLAQILSNLKPLECGVLYTHNMLALRYENQIGDVLADDAIIRVVNVYEPTTDMCLQKIFQNESLPTSDLHRNTTKSSNSSSIVSNSSNQPVSSKNSNFLNGDENKSFAGAINVIEEEEESDNFSESNASDGERYTPSDLQSPDVQEASSQESSFNTSRRRSSSFLKAGGSLVRKLSFLARRKSSVASAESDAQHQQNASPTSLEVPSSFFSSHRSSFKDSESTQMQDIESSSPSTQVTASTSVRKGSSRLSLPHVFSKRFSMSSQENGPSSAPPNMPTQNQPSILNTSTDESAKLIQSSHDQHLKEYRDTPKVELSSDFNDVDRNEAFNERNHDPQPHEHSNFSKLLNSHRRPITEANNSNLTLDDRFKVILGNKYFLETFLLFCIQDYSVENLLFWLDVKVFNTCPDWNTKGCLAIYIYKTYLAPHAPLLINLTEEMKKEIVIPSTILNVQPKTSDDQDPEMADKISRLLPLDIFDDAHSFVYGVLKGHTFARFTKSSLFNNFVSANQAEKQVYNSGYIDNSFWDNFPISMNDMNSYFKTLNMDLFKSFEKGNLNPNRNSDSHRQQEHKVDITRLEEKNEHAGKGRANDQFNESLENIQESVVHAPRKQTHESKKQFDQEKVKEISGDEDLTGAQEEVVPQDFDQFCDNFKGRYMMRVIKRYYPDIISSSDTTLYFTKLKKLILAEKKEKQEKGRRINKFFGEKLNKEQLERQAVNIKNEKKLNALEESQLSLSSLEVGARPTIIRKQKNKKLQDFFGAQVKSDMAKNAILIHHTKSKHPKDSLTPEDSTASNTLLQSRSWTASKFYGDSLLGHSKKKQLMLASKDSLNSICTSKSLSSVYNSANELSIENASEIQKMSNKERFAAKKRKEKLKKLFGEELSTAEVNNTKRNPAFSNSGAHQQNNTPSSAPSDKQKDRFSHVNMHHLLLEIENGGVDHHRPDNSYSSAESLASDQSGRKRNDKRRKLLRLKKLLGTHITEDDIIKARNNVELDVDEDNGPDSPISPQKVANSKKQISEPSRGNKKNYMKTKQNNTDNESDVKAITSTPMSSPTALHNLTQNDSSSAFSKIIRNTYLKKQKKLEQLLGSSIPGELVAGNGLHESAVDKYKGNADLIQRLFYNEDREFDFNDGHLIHQIIDTCGALTPSLMENEPGEDNQMNIESYLNEIQNGVKNKEDKEKITLSEFSISGSDESYPSSASLTDFHASPSKQNLSSMKDLLLIEDMHTTEIHRKKKLKAKKKKKMDKLKKFFGENATFNEMLEQALNRNLEQDIDRGLKALLELKQDLIEIRALKESQQNLIDASDSNLSSSVSANESDSSADGSKSVNVPAHPVAALLLKQRVKSKSSLNVQKKDKISPMESTAVGTYEKNVEMNSKRSLSLSSLSIKVQSPLSPSMSNLCVPGTSPNTITTPVTPGGMKRQSKLNNEWKSDSDS